MFLLFEFTIQANLKKSCKSLLMFYQDFSVEVLQFNEIEPESTII